MRSQNLQIGIWSDSLVHNRSSRLEGLLLEDSGGAQVTIEAACTRDVVYMTDIVVLETKNTLRRRSERVSASSRS